MIYITADPHLQHSNIIRYCKRPWIRPGDLDTEGNWVSDSIARSRCSEMDETIIVNWNSRVTSKDIIYIVGDLGFGDLNNILRRLNGTKILILGSHDKSALQYPQYFAKISPLMEIKIEEQPIILCHYAMRVWSKSHFNSWHLYGHSHGKLESQGKSFDVGVDSHDFFPWSFEEIKVKMATLPDNFNLIKK